MYFYATVPTHEKKKKRPYTASPLLTKGQSTDRLRCGFSNTNYIYSQMGLKGCHHIMVTMNHLPAEIVELVIEFACCTKFVLVSEEPVEALCYEWARKEIVIEDERPGYPYFRTVLSRYQWVPFWEEYSRERHLFGRGHDGFGIGPDPEILH